MFTRICSAAIFLTLTCLLSNSAAKAQGTLKATQWQYTLTKPAKDWTRADFNDKNWKKGFGGFGTRMTPNSRVSTVWRTNNIWLRKTVELQAVPKKPALLIYHDEDAQVYVNGQQIATFEGYVTNYKTVPLDDKGRSALQEGKNLLAVHCSQTGGGQFIDAHLVDADNVPKLPAPKRPTTPFKTHLITKWGAKVNAENAWQQYPRPQLTRKQWTNLNGHWDYAITPKKQKSTPKKWNGKILVPYCLESKLSGVQRLLAPEEALWYRRSFQVKPQNKNRVLLNFEAVDYHCQVMVNGKEVGQHKGGNTPFSFDITDAIKKGDNELIVRVEDETEGFQLRGKQTLHPRGIWYTQVSGIWQTVWLEEVPARRIDEIKILTDAKKGTITVHPKLKGKASEGEMIELQVSDGIRGQAMQTNKFDSLVMEIPDAKLWSPDSPFLYDLTLRLKQGDKVIDQVRSYAGIRDVGKVRDKDGHWRFTLNGKIIFHWGTLDQGWWPDGLLTPPSEEAMRYDIEVLKKSGFNMIRKHIKVEPRRYYYLCDQLGVMLWQDQVSGGKNPPWTRLKPNPKDAEWSKTDHAQFMLELERMVDALENHPSIVVWVPFNEAWGQHNTMDVGKWMVKRDPTRLVNVASGGNFWPVGDIVDQHSYPHPVYPFKPERDKKFIMAMGEFGGHGWPVLGHVWDQNRRNWGYGGLPKTLEELKSRYRESIRLLAELKDKGIAAGVYTQTTDVEGEINGLITYDRKVIKIPPKELKEIHQPLFEK